MAAILAVDFENALNIAGAGTPYNAVEDRWIFQVGSNVWRLSDAPVAGSNLTNTPKYVIQEVAFRIAQDSVPDEQMLDQRADAAFPCDGVAATGVTGFMHTATPSGVTGSSISRPWFYRIQDVTTLEIFRDVHQSQITDEAGWETYIASILAAIIT